MARLKALLITVIKVLFCLMQESKTEGNIPKPKITQTPAVNVIYTTEKMTLECSVQGDSSGLEYIWQKGDERLPDSPTYIIPSADQSHSGEYRCQVKKGNNTSDLSDLLPLSVADGRPKPQLTKEPASVSVFYTKESVTLKCSITEDSEGWTYLWYKGQDKKQILNSGSKSQHTLSSVVPADGGPYWCQVERAGFKSDHSDSLPLVIKELPQTTLVMQTKWTKVFPTEVVKMECDIQPPSPDWICKYYKNGQVYQTSDCMLNLQFANTGDSGDYKCIGTLRSLQTQPSNPIGVHVYGRRPKPQLTQEPASVSVFYTKESVTLKCSITEDSEGWTYLWYKGKDKNPTTNTGSQGQLTLSSVAPADGGSYWCQAERSGFKSEHSDSLSLVIKDLPQTKLVMQTKWTKFFPSEVVNMTCDIQPPSPDWICKYYRDDQELQTSDCMLNLQSANTGDSGVYKCIGTLRSLQTQPSNPIGVHVYGGRPKPQLTQEPASVSVFYTNESVTLKCNITEDSEGWTYLWYKGKDKNPTTNTGSQGQLTLSSVAPADGGLYWCQVERAGFKSEHSDSLSLMIKDLPQTKLVMQTKWTKVFPSEVVNMTCDIQPPSPEWICKYYRDDQELQTIDCMLNQSANTGDSGVYKCIGTLRSLQTQPSNPSGVHVYGGRPKPQLTQEPASVSVFYTNESVTLKCSITEDSEGWTYLWYKGKDKNPTTNTGSQSQHTLSSVTPINNGSYWCQVERAGFKSEHSDSLPLVIKDLPQTKLVMQTKWTKFFPSEVVNMTCDIQPPSPDWICKYYRDDQELQTSDCMLNLQSANTEDSGVYKCIGTLRSLQTQLNNPIGVHVYGHPPTLLLSVDPTEPPIYTKENVTLTCGVTEEQEGWTYMWYKGSDQKTPVNQASERVFTISSVQRSHNGEYKCQVKRENFFSGYSDSHGLSIEEPPVPKLERLSKWAKVFPTEKVSMKCNGIPSSSGWTYRWYRKQQPLHGQNTDTLLISSVATEYTGEYTCQGVHKRQVETVVSDSISIYVYDHKVVPTLSQHPNYTSVYVEEQVTFMCEVKIDSTDWEYQWFQSNLQEQIRDVDPRHATYTIQSASVKDDGAFWCKTKRGAYESELSTVIEIKILARPTMVVNLETGWADILSVDSLTLLCEVDNTSVTWNYTWYKEDEEMANETQKALHIKATKENYRSKYSCRGIRSNRPTYSMRSDAFIPNNIVLKRQILLSISGCLVVGFVLIVLGCVYLKFTRKPDKESKPEPDLFFTMAELKSRGDIGSNTDLCPAETSTDEPLTIEKTESEDPPCLSEGVLKEELAEENHNEEESDELTTFKV
ncbi:basement membrane-specific heparan sulfate proteoglycan core protein [Alosa sapidissima]|uniref:basement membrane-specific heparan sulfate proteoglycan core protein n=1 Tax=Alosa sapidissima TaxID=34773 RepID=UPI001C09A28F|nr:basement membrane-specific heparan sulfate proteoglycan core protein [Alosa sapidissima]